ncbi:MAG TPA: DUF222 domain-containing protein [Trebonia sp.]
MAGFMPGGEDLEWPLGGRDSRWPLFAHGGPSDRAKPNAWQVMILNDLSGPDGRCAGATDDEVFGVLGQWGAAGSWLEGRKLAVVRELIRRRPDKRNVGMATESGLPWDWDDRLAREIALKLGMSIPAARKLAWTAWALEARLPRAGKALDEGRLDPGEAKMVIEETDVLSDPEMLARAEELILAGLAKCNTWTDLLRLVQRAVVTVDPEGAVKRREQEEKENARVRFWREAAGTCALMGSGLPTDEALYAHAHVEQRAQDYRRAGVKRPIDILRVAAYLDLLNLVPAADRIARFRAEDAGAAASEDTEQAAGDARMRGAAKRAAARAGRNRPGAGDSDPGDAGGDAPAEGMPADGAPGGYTCGDGTRGDGTREEGAGDEPGGYGIPGEGSPDADDYPWDCLPDMPPCAGCGYDDCRCGGSASDGASASDGGPAGDPNSGTAPGRGPGGGPGGSSDGGGSVGGGTPDPEPAVAAEVNLTLRHLDIPLLTAAGLGQRAGEARSLGTLDPGLARRIAGAAARHPGSKFCLTIVDEEGHAIGHGCCRPRRSRKSRKSRKGQRAGPAPPVASTFTLTPSDETGPPGGFGSWILTLPGQAGELVVDLHPVPTGECGHQYESARHDPGDLLRHLITIRDGKCGFPTCSRHASESDFEHATPYDRGGRTCGCNCWACSRSCHQLKQSDGWDVTEIRPGYHQWTTPAGRTYVQEPWIYPA